MRITTMAAILATAIMTACGGSDSGNGGNTPAPCSITGTWKILDTRTTSTAGLCSDATMASSASTITITAGAAPNAFVWVDETGASYTGTINLTACTATVTTTETQALGTDANGNAITMSAVQIRNVAFTAGSMTGTVGVNFSATPAGSVTGVPCSLTASTTGTRQ